MKGVEEGKKCASEILPLNNLSCGIQLRKNGSWERKKRESERKNEEGPRAWNRLGETPTYVRDSNSFV